MSFYGGINPYESHRFGFVYIDSIEKQRTVSPALNEQPVSRFREQMDDTTGYVLRMRKAMEAVQQLMPAAAASSQIEIDVAASTTSASNVSLIPLAPATSTTLQSTEEVNSATTAYSSDPSEWNGSTAQVTIGGDYNGRNGTDTLKFKVTNPGTHGGDRVVIKAYDSNNNQVERIVINAGDAIDKAYTLKNGLTLKLGEGDVLKQDTFTIDVDDSGPGSYSTSQPQWSGTQGVAAISGEYDGRDGTGTLTFQVVREGVHGADDLRIKVYDPSGIRTDTIDILASDPIDKQYTLKNGLAFTLSEDIFLDNDTFTLEVYDNVDSAVDPDNPFNGTGSNDPNLQTGLNVTAGSFQINGTNIDVATDDSLNSVLDKINQSDVGVTATFDAASETVLLTQDRPGSRHDIVLENDTSGFLAALKLEGATATPGQDAEPEKTLAQEAQFASVQSGSISLNSVAIDIDVDTDTLTDVLDRISASAADVTASYNSASERVSVTANDSENQLIVDSGATNFFAAVNISDGTYEPVNDTIEVQTEGVDTVNASDLVAEYAKAYNTELTAAANAEPEAAATSDTVADNQMLGKLVDIISDSMNALFDDAAITTSLGASTETVQNNVRDAVGSWFDSEGPEYNTDFGIGFDFEKTKEGVFTFTEANRSQFEAALASPQSAAAVHQALFGTESDGLFNQLHAALTTAGSDSQVDLTGLFLDVTA